MLIKMLKRNICSFLQFGNMKNKAVTKVVTQEKSKKVD
jgi:hypothetical protein